MMVFTFWQSAIVCINWFTTSHVYIVMCHMANKTLSLSLPLTSDCDHTKH